MRCGGIILCGGRSSRMGRDKAMLPFGPETMLARVVRLLGEVVPLTNIAVVAAADQSLPRLPGGVVVVRDAAAYLGPLAGIAGGLRNLANRVDASFVTGCDAPLLAPSLVERIFGLLEDFDAAVPRDGAFEYPLAAVYRTSVLAVIEQSLAADQRRLRGLTAHIRTRLIDAEELRCVDPALASLRNVNSPEDYRAALDKANLAWSE